MKLAQTDLNDIDDLARADRDFARSFFPPWRRDQPAGHDAPDLLNSCRAFHMIWRLGLIHERCTAVAPALRDNWPEEWRTNEDHVRFGDRWFHALAQYVLTEHRFRQRSGTLKR